jgi:hypothetical protein
VAAPRRHCAECGSPLDDLQRYCVNCGSRGGPRSAELTELLRRTRERYAGEPAAPGPPAAAASEAPAPSRPPRSGLALPTPRISAVLVLVFLGFGVLLGNVAGTPTTGTPVASSRHLELVLPSGGAPSTPGAGATASTPPPTETPPSEPPTGATSLPPEPVPPAARAKGPAAAEAPSSEAPAASEAPPASGESHSAAPAGKLPAIRHVFVIMLADQPYASVFGPSAPPYISHTLEPQGELLARYDAVAHAELANEIALVSGQGPTAETAANCPNYTEIAATGTGAQEQVLGGGCIYPVATPTLASQLAAKNLSWRAYVQGMGEGGTAAACAHPQPGQADPSAAQAAAGPAYATFLNPFVYFRGVTASPSCAASDLSLSRLHPDLAGAGAPNFAFISPDRCHDGSPAPCAPGAPAGLAPVEAFLKSVVPTILASKAYKQGGLLAITVDQAPTSGELADSSSCCGQPQFPNLPAAPGGLAPRGGGSVGALLLSPFIKGGGSSPEPYNHFSLLRTVEDLFGLKHIGYAALAQVKPLEAAIFSAGGH